MIIKNATEQDLCLALKRINVKYKGNVCFNRYPERISKNRMRFTLRVESSKGLGHRLGQCLTSKGNRKRLTAACWHAHGDFFDALFEIVPEAVIKSTGAVDITGPRSNWQDRNIGSIYNPLMFSDACECV